MDMEGVDPRLSALAAQMKGRAREVEDLRRMAKDGGANVEEAARRFEAMFLNFLIKQMWETLGEDGLFGDAPGQQVYDGLLINTLSDYLADHGGIGMAESLASRLKAAAKAYEASREGGAGSPPAATGPSTEGRKSGRETLREIH